MSWSALNGFILAFPLRIGHRDCRVHVFAIRNLSKVVPTLEFDCFGNGIMVAINLNMMTNNLSFIASLFIVFVFDLLSLMESHMERSYAPLPVGCVLT